MRPLGGPGRELPQQGFSGRIWDAVGPESEHKLEAEEKQEKDLALFQRLVSHIFPQCGQFAGIWINAFLLQTEEQ